MTPALHCRGLDATATRNRRCRTPCIRWSSATPDAGRKVLYVNPTFTVRFNGWTEEESKPLLDYLYAHAAKPEFSCRVQWRKGSLGLWDNRATWHLALNDYPGHRQLMHRVTIDGTALSA